MKRIMKTGSFLLVVAMVIAGLTALNSCDNPISLGQHIYINGPKLELSTPTARQPVDGKFELSGDISSDNSIDRVEVRIRYTQERSPGDYIEVDLGKQWRKNGPNWEVMEDGGNWEIVQPLVVKNDKWEDVEVKPLWIGDDRRATWTIPINMEINGSIDGLSDGQYTITVTSWDKSGNSDDNSSKSRMVILYKEPPSVIVVLPNIKPEAHLLDSTTELYKLRQSNVTWQIPEFLGKYLSGEFDLQFQIVDPNDVWSIDIRFFKEGVIWKDDYDNYVYRTYINDAQHMTPISDPNYYNALLLPNYRLKVPDLSGEPFSPVQDGDRIHELKSPVGNDMSVLTVVVRCINSAGLELDIEEVVKDERMYGCFLYWPDSDFPWMESKGVLDKSFNTDTIYTTFSSSSIPVKSFDDDGIDRMEYSIYSVTDTSGTVSNIPLDGFGNITEPKEPGETKPKIYPWEFKLPGKAGDYCIRARVYDKNGAYGDAVGFFRVKDNNLPDITPPEKPVSTVPLFRYIKGNTVADWKISIEGHATDNRNIAEVKMVWINPHSANYAAMSQLAFYRDPDHIGWSIPGNPGLDGSLDPEYPNKIYTLNVVEDGYDPVTGRLQFKYSIDNLALKDLYIQPGAFNAEKDEPYEYLKSQVFVFKASNSDIDESTGKPRTSIITWAPQGDTEAPVIKINKLTIQKSNNNTRTLIPGIYDDDPILQFTNGDRITINGTWTEDSCGSPENPADPDGDLNIDNVLKNNFFITVNGKNLGTKNTDVTFNPDTGKGSSGTWTATGTVLLVGETNGVPNSDPGTHTLIAENLKDTLVISASFTDVGGNYSEDVASWLIESDTLRLLRVGSDTPSGIYKEGDKIDIFLEFNRPVSLKPGRSENPVLALLLDGGVIGEAIYDASYQDPKTPSKQHFRYTVGAGHNKTDINVTGIWVGNTSYNESNVDNINFNADGYPFTWIFTGGNNTTEEIRLVPGDRTLPQGANYLLGRIRVTDNKSDPYYVFTLQGGSSISVDTSPPALASVNPIVANIKNGWYNVGSPLYFTVKFNEPIQAGSDMPRLVMNIENKDSSGVTTWTTTNTTEVQINGDQAIFSYTVDTGDCTAGYGNLQFTGFTGDITDLAGNSFSNQITHTFTGIRVDCIVPKAPTLEVWEGINTYENMIKDSGGVGIADWTPGNYSDSDDFNNRFPDSIEKLSNVYYEKLFIKIIPEGSPGEDHTKIEYSVNYGKDWLMYDYSSPNNPKTRVNQGRYDLTARQIDSAGNVSPWSKPITLNWDKGALLTRITTDFPNGIYTTSDDPVTANTKNANKPIPIKLLFRVPVTFESSPTLTLSAKIGNDFVTLNNARPESGTPPDDKYIFDYVVGATDTTSKQPLEVTLGGTFVARDSKGALVTNMINMTRVENQDNPQGFKDLKDIQIQTGKPTLLDMTFAGSAQSDDTYNATLTFKYDRPIYMGARNDTNVITIIQQADGYRIPAILTESQRTLIRPNIHVIDLDQYYKKGTSGYINGTGPDTTTKYILDFDMDPYNITPALSGNGSLFDIFAEDFRKAESIKLRIDSSAITITNNEVTNNFTLTVSLQGSNALKVLGATYEISYPDGFVVDFLSNTCEEYSHDQPIDGVSRPSIRISKPEDIIGENNPYDNAYTSRFYISNADALGEAQIRMDCRTPGSRVRYTFTDGTQGDASISWAGTPTNPEHIDYKLDFPIAIADPVRPGDPRDGTNHFGSITTTSVTALPIGTAASSVTFAVASSTNKTENLYNGYKYRIRAVGNKGTNNSANEAEEIAYRTVIVFAAASLTAGNGQTFGNGNQLWIRGSNTPSATTIPGFPLTPEDAWSEMGPTKGKRAGIRLMNKLGTGNLTDSVWQWVTWDVNSKIYFDLYLGRDTTSSADTVKWYGPKEFAVHIGNWSGLRDYYVAFPGERRMLSNNYPNYVSAGSARQFAYTFNGTFSERP